MFVAGQKVGTRTADGIRLGRIIKTNGRKAIVRWKDGTKTKVKVEVLRRIKRKQKAKVIRRVERADKGFKQYGVQWAGVNFKLNVDHENADGIREPIHFYGWWRKTRASGSDEEIYAIDVFAKWKDKEFSVDSVTYTKDPRENMQSLTADICAIVNKWMSQKLNGNVQIIDDLVKRAAKPEIKINRLHTLDGLILKLKEVRDTAIRCGGTRIIQVHGDTEESARADIFVNVTAQAYALEGKPPSLYAGAAIDKAVTRKRGEKIEVGITKLQPDRENVEALIALLKNTKEKSKRSKIRAALRRMGHRGGAKSFERETKEKSNGKGKEQRRRKRIRRED